MSERNSNQGASTRSASIMMLLATVCVAASFPVSKSLMQYASAELALLLRFVISSVLFYMFILLRGLSAPVIPKKWRMYVFVSFFYAMFFICTFEALKLTSPFNTSVIYTLMPSVSLFLSWLIYKDLNIKHYVIPLIISTLVSVIVVSGGKLSFIEIIDAANLGDVIFLFGTICMACFFNVTKKYTANESPLISTFYILLGNTIWMSLYLFLSSEEVYFNVNIASVFELLFLVLFCTVFTFFSVQYSAKKIDSMKISSFSYLMPVFVVLMNLLFFSIEVDFVIVLSSLISVLSLFYIQWVSGVKSSL